MLTPHTKASSRSFKIWQSQPNCTTHGSANLTAEQWANTALQSTWGPGSGSAEAELREREPSSPSPLQGTKAEPALPPRTHSQTLWCTALRALLTFTSQPCCTDCHLWPVLPGFVTARTHTGLCLYPAKPALPVQRLASSLPFPLPPSHCPTLRYTSPTDSFHWPWEIGPISSGASNIILTIGLFTKGREVGYLTFVKHAKLSGWIQSQDNDSRKP